MPKLNDITQSSSKLRNASETPNFGYTHQGLEDEMVRQQTIDGSSKWIRESVTKSERVETNKDCLHYLAGITSMEDIYSDVAAFNAKRALRLIMENFDNKFWRRKLSGPVNRCWQNLGRYSELATIHLKNAADFHQFYYDARHLEVKLNDRHKKFLYNRERFAEMKHEYYTNTSKELRDWLRSQFDHLNYMVNRSKQLVEQSKSLVPIYLRTNRIKSPVNGVMLCDYETPKVKLTAGERIIIIDNMAGSLESKEKLIHRTQVNQENDITSDESQNLTSDVLDTCETDIESGSRTEEIDDRSTDSNSYLRYPTPRISTVPYWNFGRGESSGTTSTDRTTSTFTENVSPLGQSSSKLHWHIKSIDGKVEALVPSVCVWIPSPDMEAQEKAININCAHMRTIKQYEQENIVPLDLSQKLTDLQEQSFHMMETVTLVNDLAQKDKKKLDSLLNQLRIWNKQTKDKNQFNICPLSSSSDDEWLSSSGSEYINSESTYESVDETDSSYVVHSKQSKQPHFTSSLQFPHKTFILPAIFTYDEEMTCSCTTSEEIQSFGTGSSCTTDDEIEDYHKYQSKQDLYTRSDDDFLKESKNFVTTFNKQMLLTLERPVDTKDKPITYKSRKYIDTKDGGRYSVVYIEVAPTEETNVPDVTDYEHLKSSTVSKSTQSEDPLKKTRFTRRTWIEKQHVEEAKSLTKIEESARIVHSKTGKTQITDVAVEAHPNFKNAECCTRDLLTTSVHSTIEIKHLQTSKHQKNVQTQTGEHPSDFIYAVQQYAHVKEITEAQFNQLILQEAEKLNSKNKECKSCQTHKIIKDHEKFYYTREIKESDESQKLTGDFGCQYRQKVKIIDKQEHFLIDGTPKMTMSEIQSVDKINKESQTIQQSIVYSTLINQNIVFIAKDHVSDTVMKGEKMSHIVEKYVENSQYSEQGEEIINKMRQHEKREEKRNKFEISTQTEKVINEAWTQSDRPKTIIYTEEHRRKDKEKTVTTEKTTTKSEDKDTKKTKCMITTNAGTQIRKYQEKTIEAR
ncbi:hypothetical protein EWB00_008721 [Schistosoma japonicum]|uniref:Uncharacterized protein n=1 Tax=Schistosoma japonicum TaxID=6182 RepID=A0A4Z2DSG9_SCHJA|nr:hypothetical protein EWB00_008721 [Schistosoma japonicum]